MISAPIPDDEADRLERLSSFDILDTLPEQVYEDLTRLAATLFEVPIALVSLVDSDRQWFKSALGLDATETPRDISFCGHAVAAKDTLIVPDAAEDPRFADNPLVAGAPAIRFYAGAPLMTADGHALGTLCVIDRVPRDMTDEQRETLEALSRLVVSQLELRRRNAQLAHSTQVAQEARAAAEEADRAKSRFLATMSHELRTPLNGIIGFGNLIAKNKQGAVGARAVGHAKRIVANGMHLLQLINNVLDLSKVEAGRLTLKLEPLSPSAVVEEVVALLGAEAQQRSVLLRAKLTSPADFIEADQQLLKQVLINIIANALRFSEGGVVEVRVVTEADSGRTLRIDVADSGIGIPAEHFEAIFERFIQVESNTDRRYGGTGLGLPIARSLAEAMGFRLVVDSREGAGTTFSVLLDPDVDAPKHVTPDRDADDNLRVRSVG